jgi:N-acyl-D-amino-acid deacylase
MHDLVIRNGRIVDGTGSPAFSGDVAVQNGRLAQVGGKAGAARREIDAAGALVTPGFVDIHTHFDGQLTWDPYLSPSDSHGVTTIVAGNCGVGFAPAKPDKHAWLIDLMEGVEDIPGSALSEGIQWEWESFPEYLDAIARKKYAMDIGTQVPHGPLRAYVMGERGTANEEATAQDIAQMAALVTEGLRAGALGFSTSRVLIHKSKSGDLVPGTFASRDELFGIGHAIKKAGHGLFQMTGIHDKVESEYAWIADLAREAGIAVQFNFQQGDAAPNQWRDILTMMESAHAEGLKIYGGMAGRPAGMLYSWQSTIHPFVGCASWAAIAALPHAEKIVHLRNPKFRARLIAETPKDLGPTGNFVTRSFHKLFLLGDPPEYEPDPSTSIAAQAKQSGKPAAEIAYDLMMGEGAGHDGQSGTPASALLYFPIFNYSNSNLDHLITQMQSPATVLSLGDGGAHCGFICDTSLPTYMLTHWARDRSRGKKMPLEFIVNAQTQRTAQFYGMFDRGVLKPGYKADINVIDFEKLHLEAPYFTHDLPANGKRLMQKASGYLATIVNGVPVAMNCAPTGDLPGRLIRGPQRV